jgi:hypothetical protein
MRNSSGKTSGGKTILIWFLQMVLPVSLSFAEDATIQSPAPEKEVPIEQGPLRPKTEHASPQKELGEEPGMDVGNPVRRVIWQLRDYNWEENVNIRVGKFTVLGYRDANSKDKMLFRFLTKEEHAEKFVMNSKASLIGRPRKPKTSPPTVVGSKPESAH